MAEGIDKKIHDVISKMQYDYVRWNNFNCAPNFQWYYAEDRLYVIRHKYSGAYFFQDARTPLEALSQTTRMINESLLRAHNKLILFDISMDVGGVIE